MKLLIDMNLSPGWVARLAAHGLEAVHWSSIGAAFAADEEILDWARARGFVLVTCDLDFSAVLASSPRHGPSVLQLRSQDVLSDAAVAAVVAAVRTHAAHIDRGALLSIDETATRVRVLPLGPPLT